VRLDPSVIEELRVTPDEGARLKDRSTSHTKTDWLGAIGHEDPKDVAERDLESFKAELARAQEVLYASDTWSLLLIFQALDAAGKDGTIKHVMSGVNPQGCRVTAFKAPSSMELRHNFLWRCSNELPERGMIGIFNRSYYEEVLVLKVHPERIASENLPNGLGEHKHLFDERYEDINNFETHLARNGTKILKFFLHISKDEQKRRFLDRIETPEKQWKFSPTDVVERGFFDQYQQAFEDALTATSTKHAPWFVIPADHKPAMRALVGGIVANAIDGLDISLPTLSDDKRARLESARQSLLAENN